MDLSKIEQLVDLVTRSSIAELDLTQDGTRIRILKRASAGAPAVPAQAANGVKVEAPTLDHQESPNLIDRTMNILAKPCV